MGELQKTAAFIGIGTVVETASSLISNKAISLLLGPVGVGIMGQVNNYYGLGATIAEMGFLLGITRYVAEAHEQQDDSFMGNIIATSFLFTTLVACGIIIASFIFSRPLAEWILGDRALARLIWIGAPGVVFSSLYRKVDSVCQGLRNARVIMLARIILALMAPVLTVLFVLLWREPGAVVSLTLRQIAAGILAVVLLQRSLSKLGFSLRHLQYNHSALKKLLSIGLSTLVVSSMWALNTFLVRSQIVQYIKLEGAGLFQAAWGLVFMTTSLTISVLSYYTFPKVSGMSDDVSRGEVMNESIAFGILLVMAGGLAVSIPREMVIRVLFRGDFQMAGDLIPWLALGTIFYITFWVVGTPLIPKGRLVTLIVLNLLPTGLFPVLTMVCLPKWGLIGVGIAYALANLVTLLVYLVDEFRSISFRLTTDNVILLVTSAGVIVGQVMTSRPDAMGLSIRFGLACLWAVMMLRYSQRYWTWHAAYQWATAHVIRIKGMR